MARIELTYEYRMSSQVRGAGERSELLLGTSGGLTEAGLAAHPYLFKGFLTDPGPAALGASSPLRPAASPEAGWGPRFTQALHLGRRYE